MPARVLTFEILWRERVQINLEKGVTAGEASECFAYSNGHPKLIETAHYDFNEEKSKYVTLSRRWAQGYTIKLLHALSFSSDQPPAMPGLAHDFREKLDDEYLAVLWKDDMIRGLLW
ncbi:hypothetical protein PTMSG1_00475 [Pyrenophora teres f. maculata]|nr:hypothetical protein PTMSG1_00475 [Pyrenophora teres f. maculata]